MKTELTIEQSQRLIELGISARNASKTKAFDDPVSQWTNRGYPIFTLTDLLNILPKEIDGYELNISTTNHECFVSYILWDVIDDYDYIRDILQDKQSFAHELIDALYELAIFCIEHEFIKL